MSHLFVYGTLLPGEVRWALLEPFVIGEGDLDAVAGVLSDTGVGSPAASFDPPRDAQADPSGDPSEDAAASIAGRVFELRRQSEAAALELLDEVEGAVAGFYRRVEVTTRRGVAAWAYEYGGGLRLSRIASGSWLDRLRAELDEGSS